MTNVAQKHVRKCFLVNLILNKKKMRNTELLLPHICIGSSNRQTHKHIQHISNHITAPAGRSANATPVVAAQISPRPPDTAYKVRIDSLAKWPNG
jgi:hypothetical protein